MLIKGRSGVVSASVLGRFVGRLDGLGIDLGRSGAIRGRSGVDPGSIAGRFGAVPGGLPGRCRHRPILGRRGIDPGRFGSTLPQNALESPESAPNRLRKYIRSTQDRPRINPGPVSPSYPETTPDRPESTFRVRRFGVASGSNSRRCGVELESRWGRCGADLGSIRGRLGLELGSI